MSEASIKPVGEIVGPYGIDVAWVPDSTEEARAAAQPFIQDAMRAVTSEPDAMPAAIAALTIRRI